MEQLFSSLGVFVGAVLATITPFIVTYIKNKLHKNKEGKYFVQNTEIRSKINEILIEIRALVGANRVSIIEYHNGIVSTSGLPFNYASMTYESTDFVTKESIMSFQKIPTSPISKLLMSIHNCKNSYLRVGPDYSDNNIVLFNKFYGVETSYIFKISDHIKDGILTVNWVHEDTELDEDEIEQIVLKTKYIQQMMNKMNKY
jgi:hypothetical protein